MKTIGILGGMGPAATAELYNRIIFYCQKNYKAIQDEDYPPIVLYSLPLKGTDETGITDQDLVFKEFSREIKKLEMHGADFIIIPCNTLHTFNEKIRKESKIPVLSIIEETLDEVKRSEIKSLGLLASETTYRDKLYTAHLDNLVIPSNEEQKQISKVILHVMGGSNTESDKKVLLKIINNMKVEGVILGCTELSLVLKQNDTKVKILDSLHILAWSAVDRSRK